MPDEVKLLPCEELVEQIAEQFCERYGELDFAPWESIVMSIAEAIAGWNTRAIEATRPTDEVVERVAQDELAYLHGQREYFINAIIEDGGILQDVKAWLQECHDWLLTTDLDMKCPMETDPLDLIDRIYKRHSFPAIAAMKDAASD